LSRPADDGRVLGVCHVGSVSHSETNSLWRY
jgi:hypothetical protein